MKTDPMNDVDTRSVRRPPFRGRGSGREQWVDYALEMADSNKTLWVVVDEQTATIKDLEAEIALLREQIANRKPKGGRPRVPDDVVNRVERDITGGFSMRKIAHHHRVSAQTVSRIKKRMKERDMLE